MRIILGNPRLSGTECEVQVTEDRKRKDSKERGGKDEICLVSVITTNNYSNISILPMFAATKASEVPEREKTHSFLGWLGVNGLKSEQTGSRREQSHTETQICA